MPTSPNQTKRSASSTATITSTATGGAGSPSSSYGAVMPSPTMESVTTSASTSRIAPIGFSGRRRHSRAPTPASTPSAGVGQRLDDVAVAELEHARDGHQHDPQAEQREREPPHRTPRHSETWVGWTVSATTPRMSRDERFEVELVAQPAPERLQRQRGVVTAAVEAPVDHRLDPRQRRAEQRRHRQRRDRDREARPPQRRARPGARARGRWRPASRSAPRRPACAGSPGRCRRAGGAGSRCRPRPARRR